MQSFIELVKDHALILKAANKLLTLVEAPDHVPHAAFDTLRRLSCQLDAHLHAENDFLRMDADDGHREFQTLATAHGARFDDLVSEWGVFLRAWTEKNIAEDWSTFRHEAQRMMARLIAQVDEENETLYPAALKSGLIRFMPAIKSAA
mgnify:CR=1 FL=1